MNTTTLTPEFLLSFAGLLLVSVFAIAMSIKNWQMRRDLRGFRRLNAMVHYENTTLESTLSLGSAITIFLFTVVITTIVLFNLA